MGVRGSGAFKGGWSEELGLIDSCSAKNRLHKLSPLIPKPHFVHG